MGHDTLQDKACFLSHFENNLLSILFLFNNWKVTQSYKHVQSVKLFSMCFCFTYAFVLLLWIWQIISANPVSDMQFTGVISCSKPWTKKHKCQLEAMKKCLIWQEKQNTSIILLQNSSLLLHHHHLLHHGSSDTM